jgi:hypothetical protein
MIARISVRVALSVAVVATIGCDRVSKHIATATLAGEPGRSYLADTIRLEYVENRWVLESRYNLAGCGPHGCVYDWHRAHAPSAGWSGSTLSLAWTVADWNGPRSRWRRVELGRPSRSRERG